MHTVTFPWQQLPGSFKVKCITVLKDGTYLGLGEDNKQYTRSWQIQEWAPVADGNTFKWVSQLRDGGLLYVGTDGNMYTRATPTSAYTLIGNSGTVKAAAQLRSGAILAVGMDGFLYTRSHLYGDWKQVPNSSDVTGLAILADDTLVGIGTADSYLWVWAALMGGWTRVESSGPMLSVGELPDGSLVGVGTNGLVYKAPRLLVGAQTAGFMPLEVEPDPKFRVHPTPGFYKFDQNETKYSDDLLATVYPERSFDPFLSLRAYKERWNVAATNYSYASVAEYKAAWAALMSSIMGKPYTPAYEPVCVLGNACFESAPGHAAYFKGNPQDFTERHARMFASTAQYRGPGRYSILCANTQVINVTICGDTLVGKTYKIVCRWSGLVLTVKDNSATNGAQLVQAPDTGATGQRWYLRVTTGLGHCFVSKLQERVIDVPGSSWLGGTGLQLWEANGTAAQHFKLTPLGDNNFFIANSANGLVFDMPNSSTAPGTQVVQYDLNRGQNQQWTLVAV